MQENAYDEYDEADEEPSRFSRIKSAVSTAIGALVAMALLLTLGVWFYRLGVRDAQNVPIIRAAVDPAKTRPEDPGGLVAPHQDVSSYGVADSEGVQASAAVIAPAAPEPEADDIAMGDLKPVEEAPLAPVRPARASDHETLKEVSTEDLLRETEVLAAAARAAAKGKALSQENTANAKVADALAPSAKPEPDATLGEKVELALADTDSATDSATNVAVTEVETPEAEPEELTKVFVGAEPTAPSISPIALRRPADLRTRVAEATKVEAASVDNLAAAAAKSKIQIQLAADPSEATVRAMWKRIQKANSDILRDRTLAVQTTVSGGTTFYRLRVGPFENGATARAVCQALKARGQDCLVARNS
ncbi:MAG: SPOR domain-containing protein [Pseudomonadota bacterium]